MASWKLIYERWMIEDGLPELSVGQVHSWLAIWFGSDSTLGRSDCSSKAVAELDDSRYLVTAEVVFRSGSASVIDFGLRVIGNSACLPADTVEGDYVTGIVAIGLEHSTSVIPDTIFRSLAYTWRVEEIVARVETETVSGPSTTGRVVKNVNVQSTTNVEADAYILRAQLI